jgi:glyoxylase-like metal-dependent hydrolase (beta-lactamase superfamily II)
MTDVKLGDITVTRIEETHGPIMPADQFFPDVPASLWDEERPVLAPDHIGTGDNMIRVAMQSWLVRSEGKVILIDTAVGNDKARPAVPPWDHQQLDFLGNLARAGVQPQDVNLVVSTHLHSDHIGWNTRLVDGTWVPTFANAIYLMPRLDFDFWNPANNPAITGGPNENAYEDSVAPVHAAGQVTLWDTTYTIDGNLRLEAAPGHTPGSAVVMVQSRGEAALFAGDLVHSPLQIAHPGHNSCFCHDAAQALRTRRRLLSWAADTRALVMPAHFSGHSALTIEHQSSDFAIKQWAPFDRYQ